VEKSVVMVYNKLLNFAGVLGDPVELDFHKQKGYPEMKAIKKKAILIVFFSLTLLIATVAVWFFQFNPTGYRMSVSCRAFFEKFRTMFLLTGITRVTEMISQP
jgi:hypothetical protein